MNMNKEYKQLGLSTARLPMESDEDYVARINENINAMTFRGTTF